MGGARSDTHTEDRLRVTPKWWKELSVQQEWEGASCDISGACCDTLKKDKFSVIQVDEKLFVSHGWRLHVTYEWRRC